MTLKCIQQDLSAPSSPLTSSRNRDPDLIAKQVRLMLGSMAPELLRACIMGKVAALAEQDGHTLQRELRSMAARTREVPSTYANVFTDLSGMALTLCQIEVVGMGNAEVY